VLVHRSSDSCLGWWVKCGHFDITYPDYSKYYQNLKQMSQIISAQNRAIEFGMNQWTGIDAHDNLELTRVLALDPPPTHYIQNYTESDIKVKVI
jgi:hypothetical protein